MSAWVGVLQSDGGAELQARRMLSCLTDPADGEWSWSSGVAALGCRPLLVHEPVIDPWIAPARAQVAVAFDGRLDNRDVLLDASGANPQSSDAELVLACYLQYGEHCPARMEGDFAFAVADAQRGTLLLARDAIGVRPLYYAATATGFYCASRLAPLLAITGPAEPDLESIARLLCRPRSLHDGVTFFRGLHALPGATAMVVSASDQRSSKYWEASTNDYSRLDSQECNEAFRALFLQSVRRRVRGVPRAAVQVSGGLDSAAILCAAQHLGAPVFGLYHGETSGGPADETGFLAELEVNGLAIERVPLLPAGYPEHTARAVAQSEQPITDFFAGASQRAPKHASERGARLLLNGTWADQVLFPFPPGYLIDALRNFRWASIWRHLNVYPEWFADVPRAELWNAAGRSLLRAHLPGWIIKARARLRPTDAMVRLLHPRLRVLARAEAAAVQPWSSLQSHHARAVESAVRSRFDGLTLEGLAKTAAAHGLDHACPYLDRELVTLLVSAPPLAQVAGGVPKALLRQSMRGLVPDAILQRKDKGDYSEVVNRSNAAGAAEAFRQLREGFAMNLGLLDPSPFTGDLAYLQRRVNIQQQELAAALAQLYGVECWLRWFWRTAPAGAIPNEREGNHRLAIQPAPQKAVHGSEIVPLG